MANKKTKQRNAQKAKTRRAAKAKLRAKSRPKYVPPHLRPKPKLNIDKHLPISEWLFWLCHGVNYIASDYKEGTWTPVFPEIYEGTAVEPEDISKRVQQHYQDDFEGDLPTWGGKPKAVMAWTVQAREAVLIYKREVHRRIEDEGDAILPHQPKVWTVFNEVEQLFLK